MKSYIKFTDRIICAHCGFTWINYTKANFRDYWYCPGCGNLLTKNLNLVSRILLILKLFILDLFKKSVDVRIADERDFRDL